MNRIAVIALLSFAAPAAGQGTMVMAGGGAAVPVGVFEADTVDAGWSLGLTVATPVAPYLSLYAGYGRARFPVQLTPEEGEEEPEGSVDPAAPEWLDNGIQVGVRFFVPMPGVAPRINPWAQAGFLLFHRLSGDFEFGLADESPGFEVGGGANILLGEGIQLVLPVVRYRSYPYEITLVDEPVPSAVRYLTIGVGLAYNVGL